MEIWEFYSPLSFCPLSSSWWCVCCYDILRNLMDFLCMSGASIRIPLDQRPFHRLFLVISSIPGFSEHGWVTHLISSKIPLWDPILLNSDPRHKLNPLTPLAFPPEHSFPNSKSPNFNIFCHLVGLRISQINKSCSCFLTVLLNERLCLPCLPWESPQLISTFTV